MEKEDQIIHDFNDSSPKKGSLLDQHLSMNSAKPPIALFVILLVLGIGTGFLVAKLKNSSSVSMVGPNGKIQSTAIQKGQTYGTGDQKTFKDTAEGILRDGGIEGEGAYHLERPGGASQSVYLTSSLVDLSQFVGKKVKVWGQTNNAQKAGWLMDVGKLQVL